MVKIEFLEFSLGVWFKPFSFGPELILSLQYDIFGFFRPGVIDCTIYPTFIDQKRINYKHVKTDHGIFEIFTMTIVFWLEINFGPSLTFKIKVYKLIFYCPLPHHQLWAGPLIILNLRPE